jgi:hypothetical protein
MICRCEEWRLKRQDEAISSQPRSPLVPPAVQLLESKPNEMQ